MAVFDHFSTRNLQISPIFALFVLFTVTCRPSNATKVTHLQGYKMVADTVSTTTTADVNTCINSCLDTVSFCSGVVYNGTTCYQLNMLRDVVEDSASCNYYLINRVNDTEERNYLTDLQKLIYYDVYLTSTDRCPVGFVRNGSVCTMPTDAATCAEYAAFLKTSYNSTISCCVIKTRNTAFCPDPSWYALAIAAEGIGYCYFSLTVPTWRNDTSFYIDTCRNHSTATDMISIHSVAENNYINTNLGEPILGLYIPGATWSPTNFVWSDGTSKDYLNWDTAAGEPNNNIGTEFNVIMLAGGTWGDWGGFNSVTLWCKKIIYTYTYI